MATATVEERQLLKTLRWWDGFVIALCNPGFLLGALGFTLGIFGIDRLDDPVGHLSRDRHAAGLDLLRAGDDVPGTAAAASRCTRTRAGASYTHARRPALGLRLLDRLVGRALDLRQDHRRPRQAQWWPHSTWTSRSSPTTSACPLHRDRLRSSPCGRSTSSGCGPAVWFTYVCAALLMIPLALFIVVPYITGDWHASTSTRPSPARGAASSSRSSTCSSSPGRHTAPRPARRSRPSTRTP